MIENYKLKKYFNFKVYVIGAMQINTNNIVTFIMLVKSGST